MGLSHCECSSQRCTVACQPVRVQTLGGSQKSRPTHTRLHSVRNFSPSKVGVAKWLRDVLSHCECSSQRCTVACQPVRVQTLWTPRTCRSALNTAHHICTAGAPPLPPSFFPHSAISFITSARHRPHSTLTMRVTFSILLFPLLLFTCSYASPIPSSLHSAPSTPRAAFPWLDPSLSLSQRITPLLAALTLDEKVSLSQHTNPPIPHLGLPGYSWWSEGSHGVAWAGLATVFPSPIALAATWDSPLQLLIGQAVANEARGKHNAAKARRGGNSSDWEGLSFYAPNINLFMSTPPHPRTQQHSTTAHSSLSTHPVLALVLLSLCVQSLSMGQRAGVLWRGPSSDRYPGRCLCQGDADECDDVLFLLPADSVDR